VILSDGDILRVDETLTQTAGATTRSSDSGAQQRAAKAGKGNDWGRTGRKVRAVSRGRVVRQPHWSSQDQRL